MRGRKRHERALAVCVCLSLLTLFTANGYPFQERDAGIGIKDDPAESQTLSLSERDTSQQEDVDATKLLSIPTLDAMNSFHGGISTAISTSLPITSSVAGLKVLNNSSLTKNLSAFGQTALPQPSVSIIATKTIRTGSLHLTSIRNSVNSKLHPSQTVAASIKNFNRTHLSTSTNSLKHSITQPPTVNSLSKNIETIFVSRVASAATPSLVSGVVNTTGLPTNFLTQSSVKVKPSKSTILIVKPTTETSSVVKSNVQAKLTSSSKIQNLQSSKVTLPTQVPSPAPLKSSAAQKRPSSNVVPSQTVQNQPSSIVVPATKNLAGAPSTQKSSGTPPTTGTSEVPSTTVLSTYTTPEVTTKKSTQQSTKASTKQPSIKETTAAQSTTGPVSSLPLTSIKQPSTEITTTEKTRKPTAQTKKPLTKQSLTAPTTGDVPSTAPKQTKMPETTKKITTKVVKITEETTTPETTKKITTNGVIKTEKATAEQTKTRNENNDEGRMPLPNKGREAVFWDFIVPVGIGTGVALAIAIGVILVRTCRRRRLVKVRFGGKPSHPRLLNNDLINLLAESDDEEE